MAHGNVMTGHSSILTVRPLSSSADYAQAIELQRITWGRSFREIVPEAVLKITQRVGGVAAGAFNGAGAMEGFVYGMTGLYDGRLMHWSHMLAVRPELRDQGIGGKLKQFQRDQVRASGVEWMYWTFDPLVARNAHRNVNGLGVAVREYVTDMYTDTGSDLHAFGTDRFVVTLHVDAPRPNRKQVSTEPYDRLPALNDCSPEDARGVLLRGGSVRISIPGDIETLSITEARAWRQSTRAAFLTALERGYRISAFVRTGHRCYYVLSAPGA
jgi:predicted GNAT superfamily acetyltransferase